MSYVVEGATYDRLEAKCDCYREALIEADRALAAVVRYFDGQLPPAGFPLASVVKPAYRAVAVALDPAAFDPTYNATVAPSAPTRPSDPAGGETARFTTEGPGC